MSYNNAFYLHFVTDLRRAVFCLNNDNVAGAKTFLLHANKIYEEKLRQIMDGEKKELNFNQLWTEIFKTEFPMEITARKKYGDKILTLASMIFVRSAKNMPILPNDAKMAEKKVPVTA